MQVNLPEIVAELSEVFAAYERALMSNDVAALNAMFWPNPLALRYGISDTQSSHREIAEFRRGRGATNPRRSLRNTRITTFGRDFGVANTEFVRAGSSRVGRQSQTWLRTPGGWKIVSAHVSFPEEARG